MPHSHSTHGHIHRHHTKHQHQQSALHQQTSSSFPSSHIHHSMVCRHILHNIHHIYGPGHIHRHGTKHQHLHQHWDQQQLLALPQLLSSSFPSICHSKVCRHHSHNIHHIYGQDHSHTRHQHQHLHQLQAQHQLLQEQQG